MKKATLLVALCTIAFNTMVLAQSKPSNVEDIQLSGVKLEDGENSIRIPGGKGTITLVKRGSTFFNVTFTDAKGRVSRLIPADQAPTPECECPMPDACFSIPNNQQYGMCICNACDIADGSYNVSLLLPAVQSAREAARRAQ